MLAGRHGWGNEKGNEYEIERETLPSRISFISARTRASVNTKHTHTHNIHTYTYTRRDVHLHIHVHRTCLIDRGFS